MSKLSIATMCVYETTCRQKGMRSLPLCFFTELESLCREGVDQVVFASRALHCIHTMSSLLNTNEGTSSPQAMFAALFRSKVQKCNKEGDETLEEEEGFITCRCGSKKVKWMDKHTRSADEGSTVFLCCTQCGEQWKMSA